MPILSRKTEFDSLALIQLLIFIVVPEDVTARSFQPVLDENRAVKYRNAKKTTKKAISVC